MNLFKKTFLIAFIASLLSAACSSTEHRDHAQDFFIEEAYIDYPIHLLARFGNTNGIEKLFKNNYSAIDRVSPPDDWTALMLASAYGHLDTVKFLISKGAKIDFRSEKCGCTALLTATHQQETNENHYKVVEFLLSKGADSNAVDNLGDDALIVPVKNKKYEIVKLLLTKRKFNLSRRNKEGRSAMDYAKDNEDTEMIKILESHSNISR
ncbi:ankyrin repeat domain-containing protein [Leptospira koniambonensis]|uniref:Ankyrin repeat domain-containing protein n=1 Tax=Leptospira koniambonensis TaxID=2484950 RepID=A0A4R9J551_9LEPT|nr:ankyrin repeat domain-containing protein [Leptospira koniambonensis]TGL33743.1 ankyrin repeat domain-containing protein [Leptospira koniambonensis]